MAKKSKTTEEKVVVVKSTELEAVKEVHEKVSAIKTPKYYVNDKGGFDYVDEGYMRKVLNTEFPVWSWEVKKYEFIGDKAIAVHGRLTIQDNGIVRHFESVAAHRIAISKKDGNYTDLGNDLKSAVTDCFKVCVNRLCNVADDVYRKQCLSSEQIKSLEDLAKILGDSVQRKVVTSIKSKQVNPSNYLEWVDRLEQIKKDKGESDE
jgi:hypothetical protein